MTRERAIEILNMCQKDGDFERAHSTADRVLCAILSELGYGDVVGEYEKVERQCA